MHQVEVEPAGKTLWWIVRVAAMKLGFLAGDHGGGRRTTALLRIAGALVFRRVLRQGGDDRRRGKDGGVLRDPAEGLPSGAERAANAKAAGALAMVNVDDPYFYD